MKIIEDQIPYLLKQNKERLVLTHLYKEVFPTVQNYIRKNHGNSDDAFDVFQDALLCFYHQVMKNTFDPKYTVYGYLFRLSINRWLNKLKKDKKTIFQTEFDEEMIEDFSYLKIGEQQNNQKDGSELLKKFVAFIGERCEQILSLRIYSNLMFEDIMLRMEYNTEAAAKMNFKRCREKLVEVIKKNPELESYLRQK